MISKANGMRAIPDVSYDADPASGYPVYITSGTGAKAKGAWDEVGGTSAGAPQWAAIQALGGSAALAKFYTDKASTSTLKYFRDEYLAHIEEKRCPAHICAALLTFTIRDNCTGCTVCAKACPTQAITGDRKKMHVIEQDKCIQCGKCFTVCRFDAVLKD